jgi:DNA-binding MarR family transcriptional regulator
MLSLRNETICLSDLPRSGMGTDTWAEELPPGDPFLDSAINASRVLVGIAVRAMSEAVPEASLPVWRGLWVLGERGPQRPGDMAEALDMSAATGTRVCATLAKRRLADRYEDPDDGRSVRFAITDKGYGMLAMVVARQRAAFARALEELPPAQRDCLAEAFEALYGSARDAGVLWP